jgi:hypothetical protein
VKAVIFVGLQGAKLEEASQQSKLPEAAAMMSALVEWLVRIRLGEKANEVH